MPPYTRISIALLAVLLVTSAGAAQQPQPVPPTVVAPATPAAPTSPPVIPDALRAQFFKAKSDLLESQQAAATLQQAVQDAIAAMRGACGTATLTLGPGGQPICQAAAPQPTAPAAPTAK